MWLIFLQYKLIIILFKKADIIHKEDFEHPKPIQFAETVDVDDKLIHINSNDVKDNPVDKFCFYDDPRPQMDDRAKCSVTNKVEILQDVKWFNGKTKTSIQMRGAISGNIIIPSA